MEKGDMVRACKKTYEVLGGHSSHKSQATTGHFPPYNYHNHLLCAYMHVGGMWEVVWSMHVSIQVCAPTYMQRPEVRHSLLYLIALRPGLSLNWKSTFAARLPGHPGSSQYLLVSAPSQCWGHRYA